MQQETYQFGEFTLDARRRSLRLGGAPVELGSRAFDVLLALLRRAGETATKRELLAEVWPAQRVEENNLTTQIAAIRRALGEAGAQVIATISGRGYRVAVPVRTQAAEALALGPARHNLPGEVSSFVNRVDELARIAERLRQRPLVTLLGAGGVGKTRLALRAASTQLDNFADGAWLVELAPLTDPSLVAEAACRALSVPVSAGADAQTALTTLLRHKRLLLILDNCEHVLAGAASLAAAIGRTCPDLRILATSRERLRVAGEAVFPLPTLGVPPASDTLTAAEALTSHSVQMFAERAADALGSFTLTDREAPAVAAICRRLDGLPLATELAAACLRVLQPAEIAARLETIFTLLGPGIRQAAPGHQRTLRTTIDWSYSQLAEPERVLLQRLSVFPDGCTLDGAIEVASGDAVEPAAMIELLSALIDKSLLLADTSGTATRYRMLETTRQYAAEKLAETGAAPWRRRHALYVLSVFEAAERSWPTSPTARWLGTYAPEIDSLRAAIDWAFAQPDVVLGAALVAHAGLIAAEASLQPDLQRWTALAWPHLAELPPPIAAAIAYLHATRLKQLGLSEVTPEWRHAIALAREAGDKVRLSRALRQAAIGMAAPGADPAQPLAMLEEAVALLRHLPPNKDLAFALAHTGSVHFLAGDHGAARCFNQEALAHRQALGDRTGVLASHVNLAELCFLEGDHAQALRYAMEADAEARQARALATQAHILGNLAGYRLALDDRALGTEAALEALRLNRALGQENFAVICLEHLALAALLGGEPERAARLLGYTAAQYAALGQARDRLEQAGFERLVAGLAEALSPARLDQLLEEGAALSEAEADALARPAALPEQDRAAS